VRKGSDPKLDVGQIYSTRSTKSQTLDALEKTGPDLTNSPFA